MARPLQVMSWAGRLACAAVCGSLAMAVGAAAAGDGGVADAARLAEGKVLFQKDAVPACAVCHTLQDAGAAGAIGPDLDELQPSRQQILAVLRDGSGVMPSFADTLSEAQRESLADYVVWATRLH